MGSKRLKRRRGTSPGEARRRPARAVKRKESWLEQASSFVGFFIYLLILKTFFLPLFIIPTGSMAETLYGQHAMHTCPNCGIEYAVGWQPQGVRYVGLYQPVVQCPNCRWREYYGNLAALDRDRERPDSSLRRPLRPSAGDRIFVHGWLFDQPLAGIAGLGPARWDVVVFKVPTDGRTNYIKRLIGLPGETIELVNGDVFVGKPDGQGGLDWQIARKTEDAQRALWFPYYNHDYPPARPALQAAYYPRWAALEPDSPWSGLQTRVVRFLGVGRPRSEIHFTTDPDDPTRPGLIQDVYAYNEPRPASSGREMPAHCINDVRLSAEVELTGEGGYVEFSLTRAEHCFYVRLATDGRLTLEHRTQADPDRRTWAQRSLSAFDRPIHLALCHVDGVVRVEVDGRTALESTPEQYTITREIARRQSESHVSPVLRIAAENVEATFRHLLIERDVYYTSEVRVPDRPAFGVQGNPITLGPGEYFVLGDNSPNSQDARYAFARPGQDPIGPHLKAAAARGEYREGRVPADQMIGRAFFVYWPGVLPLTPYGPNLLPDLGRARWIR